MITIAHAGSTGTCYDNNNKTGLEALVSDMAIGRLLPLRRLGQGIYLIDDECAIWRQIRRRIMLPYGNHRVAAAGGRRRSTTVTSCVDGVRMATFGMGPHEWQTAA